jgi:hypothetical protein
MKKYLLILLFLCVCGYVNAQSVTINDLTNLAHLSNEEAHNYLTHARAFKRDFVKEINGLQVETYKCITKKTKRETIVVGNGTRIAGGGLLRSVTYESNNQQQILNLIGQAGKSDLKLSFKGLDANRNIFIFDNDLYNMVISLNIYDGAGSIKVKQKEFIGAN